MVVAVTTVAVRTLPVVQVLRLDDLLAAPKTDGFRRSWIPILPCGEYEHPTWGTLDFTEQTLSEIKQHFDEGVRGIEIALDYDHKASEGESAAPGWIEKLAFGHDIGKGDTPAMRDGLWAYVRWTRLGLRDVQDQIYRYISAEVKPEYHNDITGEDYQNVLVGTTLTNRPFMKQMPAIELAEVSRKAWGSVNKSKLPDSAFLDRKNRRLPIYEGTGPMDANGRYTKRGALNLKGAQAALAAIHGAHTGKAMTGLPSGTASRLQAILDRYSGSGSDGDDSGNGNSEQMADDPEADGIAAADTHGPMSLKNGNPHTHGKYDAHYHLNDRNHSFAPMKGDGAQDYGDFLAARARLARSQKHSEVVVDSGDSGGSGGENVEMRTKRATLDGRELTHEETLQQFLAERADQRGGVMLSSATKSAATKLSKKAADVEPRDDGEDEGDGEDGTPKGNPGASRKMSRKLAKKLDDGEEDGADDTESMADGGGTSDEDDTDDWDGNDDGEDDGDGASDDGTVQARGGRKMSSKAHGRPLDDGEGDDETSMAEDGTNMDGADDELDEDDDSTDGLDKYLPNAALTGKGTKGRAVKPMGGAGKHQNMSEQHTRSRSDSAMTLREQQTMREELAAARLELAEARVDKQLRSFSKLNLKLAEGEPKGAAGKELMDLQYGISKRFREAYRKFMLGSAGYRFSESDSSKLNELLDTALKFAVVDLARRGSSFDMEQRKTVKASDEKNPSTQDRRLAEATEIVSQRDFGISMAEVRGLIREGDRRTQDDARAKLQLILKRAADESGYRGQFVG